MDKPEFSVNLRPSTNSSSSMEFPQELQDKLSQPKPEIKSPRQMYEEHQESMISGKSTISETGSKTAGFSHENTAQSTGFQASCEIDREGQSQPNSMLKDVKVKTESSRTLATGLTAADKDAGVCSVWLPSGFYFYDFSSLSVAFPLKGRHQAKFNKAHEERSIRYTVEAITSCLGDGINSMDLTPNDFYFVMYWLRLVSYTKSPYLHTVVCESDNHLDMVDQGKVSEDTLKSIHTVNNTSLLETSFDPSRLEALKTPELDSLGLVLRPATMADVVAFSEEISIPLIDKTGNKDPRYSEFAFLGDLASYVKSYQGDTTLSLGQKMTVIGDLSVDALDEVRAFIKAVSDYGVTETIKVACPTCGEVIESEVSIQPSSFL